MKKKRTIHRDGQPGNFVSEWFGHRVYPMVVSTDAAIEGQRREQCPFLSAAASEERTCFKSEAARGVCTISSASNGPRQDWLVCPYRALSHGLLANAARRLFGLVDADTIGLTVLPAVTLNRVETREEIAGRLKSGGRVFIHFDAKLGGELSIPETARSPEFSFDVTLIELVDRSGVLHVGRFGFLEIQTVDFHGSYRTAVRNLREGLRLYGTRFGETLREYPQWLCEGVEGPNISNVFKRTFYQMMFKFQLGKHERCAGCVLAIPQAVWDSWQKHLGKPELSEGPCGIHLLSAPGHSLTEESIAWIFVFDTAPTDDLTPSPLEIKRVIETSAPAVGYWALEKAPEAALANIGGEQGLLVAMAKRLRTIWPELGRTVEL